ncbi:MAG: potassium channel protein [Planctomycetales bacterium]|nr:potassium channel protein [Planctomycetales bacterium]
MKRRIRYLTPLQKTLAGLTVTLLVVITSTVAYRLNGWSWEDSFYMVIVTIFGIGYREIQPVDTSTLRWITIGLIVLGYAAAIYTVTGLAQMVIDGQLRKLLGERKMQRDISRLNQHIVICGFGRMGSKLAESLVVRGKRLVVVEQNAEQVAMAQELGYLVVQGNATDEEVLKEAGIERAAVLATVLSNDVANVFITITAHDLNPGLEILARAEETSTIKKLRQVGASKIVLPASIGADRLANLILRPSAESLLRNAQLAEGLNEDLFSLGLRLDDLQIEHGSALIGQSVERLRENCNHQVLIVALRAAGGEIILTPSLDQILSQGDCVVILGRDQDICQLCEQFDLRSELEMESQEVESMVDRN